jgi:hypothetical protein
VRRAETPRAASKKQPSEKGRIAAAIRPSLCRFRPHAAGRTFSVEAFATDDAGSRQGFELMETISVLPHWLVRK